MMCLTELRKLENLCADEGLSLESFCQLDENDLRELGFKMGARKLMNTK
jgi:hypothetical protein